MAYTAITSTEIQVGKALKEDLFSKIKDNFTDHESRITSLETTASTVIIFDDTYNVNTVPNSGDVINYYRVPFNMAIQELKLESFVASGTGTITIDLFKGSTLNVATASSILTSTLSINFTGGNYQVASASLNPALQNFAQGEYLFLKIISLPAACDKFRVTAIGL